jgi:hypothetical protein
MSLKKAFGLLSLAAMAGVGMSSKALAVTPVITPTVTVTENGNVVTAANTTYITRGTAFSGSGSTNDFSWSFSGNSDPLINWSFSATGPGIYSVQFSSPVFDGPYTIMKNQAALAMSDIGFDGNATSVTGVSLQGQDPIGSPIAEETMTGDLTVSDGATGSISYGPATAIGAFSGGSFAEVLQFTLTSPGGDGSAGFSGQLVLTPEPASLGLLGFGVAGLLWKRKR